MDVEATPKDTAHVIVINWQLKLSRNKLPAVPSAPPKWAASETRAPLFRTSILQAETVTPPLQKYKTKMDGGEDRHTQALFKADTIPDLQKEETAAKIVRGHAMGQV